MDAQKQKLGGKYSKGAPTKDIVSDIGFYWPVERESSEEDGEGGGEASAMNIDDTVTVEETSVKKKTPKERRSASTSVKKDELKNMDKRNFKENFNTDKTRLEKRHLKFDRPQDFLLLVKDSIHEVSGGSKTAGKYMVYGKGQAMEMFLHGGVSYSRDSFYIHENNIDFTEKTVKQDNDENEDTDEEENDEPIRKRPRRKIFPSSLARQLERRRACRSSDSEKDHSKDDLEEKNYSLARVQQDRMTMDDLDNLVEDEVEGADWKPSE